MTLRGLYTPLFMKPRFPYAISTGALLKRAFLKCVLLKCAPLKLSLLQRSMLLRSLLMSALLPLTAAHAEEIMQVNLLVFTQPEHGVSFELWRPAEEMQLEYPLQRVDFKGLQVERDERFNDFGLIMSDRIARAGQRLQSSDYRVLVQQSWTQPVLPLDQSFAIVLGGGQSLGDHQELEGYVTIYRSEQRIRLGTHLWLSSAGNANNTPAPAYPVEPLPELGQGTHNVGSNNTTSASQWVVLNDTRILNEGDLHYIDHPRFGMLIEILPPGGMPTSDSETTEADSQNAPPEDRGPEETGNEATGENSSDADGNASGTSEAAE